MSCSAVMMLASAAAGCSALPDTTSGKGRVFLIAGSLPGCSRGFSGVAERLRSAGVYVVTANRWDRGRIAGRLVKQSEQGPGSPIVLVGHSGGGRDSIRIARTLGNSGVVVAGLICLDTAWADAIPSNVCRATHFYLTRDRVYPAKPLAYVVGSTKRVRNVDLNAALPDAALADVHHGSVDDARSVQDLIFEEVMRAVGGGTPRPRRPSSGRGPTGTAPDEGG